ncbi:MAG: sulfite exporter TauE/SafE family protein [Candidatus Kerfeldbacteria bacterium]|nr:sulfite exporter TauE/SafE family protein [Candidatus Kerfeldbacteria bacterium]
MDLLGLALLTLVASAIGTLTGFGTSTIMIPVVALYVPFPVTLVLVGTIHWFGNIWKILLFRGGFSRKLLLWFGLPGLITSFLGASLTIRTDTDLLQRLLGYLLVAYVFFLVLKPKFKVSQTPTTAITGGALSGLMAGIFGIGGAVRGAALSAFNLPAATFIFTAGAIGVLIDSTRLITYLADGVAVPTRLLAGLFLFVPISFLGAKIGERLVKRVPAEKFRTIVAMFLFVIGVWLVVQ